MKSLMFDSMKKRMVLLLSAIAMCMPAWSQVYGDVDGDGRVDVSDVNAAINIILELKTADDYLGNADLNGDEKVDVSDVSAVINVILDVDNPVEPGVTTYTVNGVSFKMVYVDGGTFTMGATEEQGSDYYPDELPTHQVTLSSYSIGATEVTQELWQAVMGDNPSHFNGVQTEWCLDFETWEEYPDDVDYGTNLQRPVENVNWDICQEFITELNQLTGKNFRLPTEAEWEYAARGGSKSQGYKYAGSNTIGDVAWYMDNNPGSGTQPVGTKAPNELGLYDMSGNVNEWCQDWYGSYPSDSQVNPVGPATGSNHVYRGGNLSDFAKYCRVSNRYMSGPENWLHFVGMRLVLPH